MSAMCWEKGTSLLSTPKAPQAPLKTIEVFQIWLVGSLGQLLRRPLMTEACVAKVCVCRRESALHGGVLCRGRHFGFKSTRGDK
jgi:hypothetical protein